MKREIRTIIIAILTAFSIISAGFVCYVFHNNHRIEKGFTKVENAYPYAEAVGNNELDLTAVSDYFSYDMALGKYDYQYEIVTPFVISYYAEIGDKTPVLTIEKGEIMSISIQGMTESTFTFRGIESLPTNKAGWRLAKPFSVVGKEATDALLYVKLDELKSVVVQWLKENPSAELALGNTVMVQGLKPTKRNMCSYLALVSDRTFYTRGVFLSADLKQSISLPALCLIISLLILVVVVYISKRKRQKLLQCQIQKSILEDQKPTE